MRPVRVEERDRREDVNDVLIPMPLVVKGSQEPLVGLVDVLFLQI